MRYIKAEFGNGWCGMDDEFLMEFSDNIPDDVISEDVFSNYAYIEGGGGLDPYDEDGNYECYDDYVDDIWANSNWEDISEEEFIQLRDEEGWDVR